MVALSVAGLDGYRLDGTSEPARISRDPVELVAAVIGALVNRVRSSEAAAPWTFGMYALYRSLAVRGLLR